MPRIEANKLRFSFDDRLVLDDISFRWEASRIGVIGRNGSGKSTLARLIAGLLEPRAGEILVNAHDLYKQRDVALETVGIVFQNPDHQIIFPSVIEELKFGFAQISRQDAEEKALAVLEKYGRLDWKDRLVNGLSQGQRQFLALISIVELQPEVLILDEPFTGLDIPSVVRLQKVLDRFAGTIIHITHEPSLIEDYTLVAWIENGKLALEGEAKDVINAYNLAMNEMAKTDARTGF